jgi:hypothetical protein
MSLARERAAATSSCRIQARAAWPAILDEANVERTMAHVSAREAAATLEMVFSANSTHRLSFL